VSQKSDYTDPEWQQLKTAPLVAGIGVAAADFGVVSLAREIKAVTQAILTASAKRPDNALIKAVVTQLGEDEQSKPEAPPAPANVEQIVAQMQAIGTLLAAKSTPEEAAGFKAFVYEMADVSANASGSGFLGTGEKVSAKEAAYLAQLKAALGL
jgi:hypothetical protein